MCWWEVREGWEVREERVLVGWEGGVCASGVGRVRWDVCALDFGFLPCHKTMVLMATD